MFAAIGAVLIVAGWGTGLVFAGAAIRRPRSRAELLGGWLLGAGLVTMAVVGALG